ncbi:MAG: hypothetical protein DRK00_02445 [Thermoprotei archaeon]|nr:MAG: hypothetical protein DRK00_02445 [Thermoprotei archaeon]
MRGLLLLAIIVAAAAAPALADPQASFELYDAYWETPPSPGLNATLVVRVRYLEPAAQLNVSARLTIRGVCGRDLSANDSYAGLLQQGSVLDFHFRVEVPEGALASYYPATLTLECDGHSEAFSFDVGFGGEPRFTASPDKTTLRRGEVNEVTITLMLEEAPAREVEVRVAPASPFVTILGENTFRRGMMMVGDDMVLSVKVLVDSSAGDTASVAVTISCEDYMRTPHTSSVTLGFRVVRAGGPHFTCDVMPSRVVSGRRVSLSFYLHNTGSGPARDVRVSLTPVSPGIALLSGSSVTLGDIGAGETRAFTALVRVDRGVTGTASLQLLVEYYDAYGDAGVERIGIGLEVARSPLPLLILRLLNDSLPADKAAVLAVEVTNVGDADALDLTLDLESGRGIYAVESSRVKLDRIGSGESEVLTFKVVASPAGRDTAVATFRLRYYDEAGYEYADTTSISIRALKPGEPCIVIRQLNRTLKPNDVNRVALEIWNEGDGAASNLTITLTSQSIEIGAVIGPSTKILGVLEPNESTIAVFEVFVQPRIYGALQLVAALSYRDEGGREHRRLMTLGYEVRGDWELSVASAVTVPPVVFPGDEMVRVVLTVVNSGDYMARNVELVFVGDEWIRPTTAAGARALLPYLPVGQAATLTFIVDVSEDAPVGNHDLLLNASGRQLRFTLTVLEKAKFSVRNVTSLEVESGGKGYRLVFEVENTSHAYAEDVRVELYSPFLTGSTSTYLGTLAPREKKLVVFEVDVDPATLPGPLKAELKVRWSQEGRSLSQYTSITLSVRAPRPVNALLVAAAAATAAAALLYLKRGALRRLLRREGPE